MSYTILQLSPQTFNCISMMKTDVIAPRLVLVECCIVYSHHRYKVISSSWHIHVGSRTIMVNSCIRTFMLLDERPYCHLLFVSHRKQNEVKWSNSLNNAKHPVLSFVDIQVLLSRQMTQTASIYLHVTSKSPILHACFFSPPYQCTSRV